MNPQMIHLFCIAALTLTAAWHGFGQEAAVKPDVTQPAKPVKAAPKSMYPFRGMVSTVDVKAATVGLARQGGGPRVLHIGAESLLVRDGNEITLESVKSGDYLKGRVERQPNGDEIIVKATVGEKADKDSDSGREKAKAKDGSN